MIEPKAFDRRGRERSVTSAIWRAGAVPAALAWGVVCVVGLVDGGDGVLGAVVGGGLALVALSVPVLVVRATSQAAPPAVMAAALGGYLVCVAVLGGAWLALAERSWLSGSFLAAALFAVTAVWMAGQVRGLLRLRVLAFGEAGASPSAGDDVPGQGTDRPV